MASSSDAGGPGFPFAVHGSEPMDLDTEAGASLTGAPVIRGDKFAKRGQRGDLSAITEDDSDSSWQQVQDSGTGTGTMQSFVRAPGPYNASNLILSPHASEIQSTVNRVIAEQRAINSAGLPVLNRVVQEQTTNISQIVVNDLQYFTGLVNL